METPLPDPGAAAGPETPEVQIKLGTNWSLLRNLVIIVLLLAAIFGMYKAYQWQKSENARHSDDGAEPGPGLGPVGAALAFDDLVNVMAIALGVAGAGHGTEDMLAMAPVGSQP